MCEPNDRCSLKLLSNIVGKLLPNTAIYRLVGTERKRRYEKDGKL